MTPFFILALPRSRGAWLANLLTQGSVFCAHEALIGCPSVDALDAKFKDLQTNTGAKFVGSVDGAAAAIMGRILAKYVKPAPKVVVIERNDLKAVKSSLIKAGFDQGQELTMDHMRMMKDHLDTAKVSAGALVVSIHDLNTYEGCNKVLQYIAPSVPPLNHRRWEMLNDFKVQVFAERHNTKIRNSAHHTRSMFAPGGNAK